MCQEFFIVNKIRRTAQKKDLALSQKKPWRTVRVSVVVDLDRFLSSLFPAETEVLATVLSRLIDVVVVNLVVVLKFPIGAHIEVFTPHARERKIK